MSLHSKEKVEDSQKIYICKWEDCEDMKTEPKNLCCLCCPLKSTCKYQCDMIRDGEITKPEECEYAEAIEVAENE